MSVFYKLVVERRRYNKVHRARSSHFYWIIEIQHRVERQFNRKPGNTSHYSLWSYRFLRALSSSYLLLLPLQREIIKTRWKHILFSLMHHSSTHSTLIGIEGVFVERPTVGYVSPPRFQTISLFEGENLNDLTNKARTTSVGDLVMF